jgi:hypothetical protein
MMSLPVACGTTVDTIPDRVPYLRVPEEERKAGAAVQRETGCLHIGLSWAGNPRHNEDRLRSLQLSQLQSLLSLPGLRFFSIQIGPSASQLSEYPEVIDLQSSIHDLADTAAIVSKLDLVITVDSAVAHLTGALGRPAWVLIPFAPDWRWLLDRDDSPWYPTLRVFRQPRLGDWVSAIQRVRMELNWLLRNGGLPSSQDLLGHSEATPDARATSILPN